MGKMERKGWTGEVEGWSGETGGGGRDGMKEGFGDEGIAWKRGVGIRVGKEKVNK